MKVLILMTVTSLLVACGGKRAVRVDCERHLTPINVPAPSTVDRPSSDGSEGNRR